MGITLRAFLQSEKVGGWRSERPWLTHHMLLATAHEAAGLLEVHLGRQPRSHVSHLPPTRTPLSAHPPR